MSLTERIQPDLEVPDRRDLLTVLAFVLGINAVGAAPALLGGPESAWFQALEQPWFYPPGWLFGVVWTALFTLMGVAVYLVYRQGIANRPVKVALGLFGLQMIVNVSWTPVFFTAQEPGYALVIVGTLVVLVAVTIVAFARVDRRAAALLIPYLLWGAFATMLNYAIWTLN